MHILLTHSYKVLEINIVNKKDILTLEGILEDSMEMVTHPLWQLISGKYIWSQKGHNFCL